MKILLTAPNYLKTVPMGVYAAKTLQMLGHEVRMMDSSGGTWRNLTDRVTEKFLRFSETKPLSNANLRENLQSFKPDLFLAIFGFEHSPQSLKFARKLKIPTACWWINDPFQFKRSMEMARHYDFLFTNACGCVEDYIREGIKAHHLPAGCEPSIHRKVAPDPQFACDVCFAGDWSRLREELMLKIAPICELKIFGPWRKNWQKIRHYGAV